MAEIRQDGFTETFDSLDRGFWYMSDFTLTKHNWINTAWEADNIVQSDGVITLELNTDDRDGKKFTGAEIQSKPRYEYGLYEVEMQPSGEVGVNSSFFTYTGPHLGDGWNEIDFEFLGKDPTTVHVAYHTDAGSHGTYIDLGFDASEEMHTYAFEWLPNSIRWFVDGTLIYEVVDPEVPVPDTASKIYMNIWAGHTGWLGTAEFADATHATYSTVRYTEYDTPEESLYPWDGNEPVPVPVPPEVEPTEGSIMELGQITVAQDSADSWHSVSFSSTIDGAVVGMGPLTFAGAQPATVRVRNVTDQGFEFQVDEWDYLDGRHYAETVSWIAVSAGDHQLADGRSISAGVVTATNEDPTAVALSNFDAAPIILSQVSSANDAAAVTTRLGDVSADGFKVLMQEEEAADGVHGEEQISWIAVDAGGGGGLLAGLTGDAVTHRQHDIAFDLSSADGDLAFLADVQTLNGQDAGNLRLNGFDASGATIHFSEELSRDSETRHYTEEVGWFSGEVGTYDLL